MRAPSLISAAARLAHKTGKLKTPRRRRVVSQTSGIVKVTTDRESAGLGAREAGAAARHRPPTRLRESCLTDRRLAKLLPVDRWPDRAEAHASRWFSPVA